MATPAKIVCTKTGVSSRPCNVVLIKININSLEQKSASKDKTKLAHQGNKPDNEACDNFINDHQLANSRVNIEKELQSRSSEIPVTPMNSEPVVQKSRIEHDLKQNAPGHAVDKSYKEITGLPKLSAEEYMECLGEKEIAYDGNMDLSSATVDTENAKRKLEIPDIEKLSDFSEIEESFEKECLESIINTLESENGCSVPINDHNTIKPFDASKEADQHVNTPILDCEATSKNQYDTELEKENIDDKIKACCVEIEPMTKPSLQICHPDSINYSNNTFHEINDQEKSSKIADTRICSVVLEKISSSKLPSSDNKMLVKEISDVLNNSSSHEFNSDENHNYILSHKVRKSNRITNKKVETVEWSDSDIDFSHRPNLRKHGQINYNLSDNEESLNESTLDYSKIDEESADSDSNLDNSFCAICKGYDDPELSEEHEKDTEWLGCDCDRWYHTSCLSHVAARVGLQLDRESFNCEQINHECIQ